MPDALSLPPSVSGDEALAVARRCATAARKLIRRGYGRTLEPGVKAHRSVVTEIDVAAEKAVLAILAREYPAIPVLAEETATETEPATWMWVVDPIDGTRNYSRAIPHFAFSIALCREGEAVLGLTEHPLLRHEVAAVHGLGATLNGHPVRVGTGRGLGQAVIALDLGFRDDAGAAQLDLARALWSRVQAIRIAGSAALGFAYVAAGRWDAFVHRDLEPWDLAAGIALVREAGGIVTTLDGGPPSLRSRALVAASPGTHGPLLGAIRSARAAPGPTWPAREERPGIG